MRVRRWGALYVGTIARVASATSRPPAHPHLLIRNFCLHTRQDAGPRDLTRGCLRYSYHGASSPPLPGGSLSLSLLGGSVRSNHGA